MRFRLYGWWQKFLHRHNFHRLTVYAPTAEDQLHSAVTCQWCGMHGRVVLNTPAAQAERRRLMAEEMAARA